MRVADAAGTAASVTRNVMLAEPTADEVPLITPALDSARPAGNDPLATDHRYGRTPPEA